MFTPPPFLSSSARARRAVCHRPGLRRIKQTSLARPTIMLKRYSIFNVTATTRGCESLQCIFGEFEIIL